MKIWKFKLPMDVPSGEDAGFVSIDMPKGARIVSVGIDTEPCLWAEVDPDAPLRRYHLACVWIGRRNVPEGYAHLKSLIDPVGLVWHFYKKEEGSDGEKILADDESGYRGLTLEQLTSFYSAMGEQLGAKDIGTDIKRDLRKALQGDPAHIDHPVIKAARHQGFFVEPVPPRGDETEERYRLVPIDAV